ncbi:LOW QUALITY PROTEIN: sperm motility kinase Z-like [Callospermophilus lateralis]|uniref:LOW QUALITY PROTEIN: sperm motility kinase Z-like n=1 Tax=Callospermophilus lateralis TaxID=76772 RepID=UPI004038DC03
MNYKSSQTSAVLQEPCSCDEIPFTDHYQLLKTIGHGGFGQVKLARHLLTGAEVAVKILPKEGQVFPVLSEPDIMMTLSHPHVIQLFQVIETGQNAYLVMEYASGGQLSHHIQAGGMQEEEARRLFRQIARAVDYCHKKGVVHRDLKVENIMLDARGNIKLIDFGLNARFIVGLKLNRFWGTLAYLAPEIALRQEYEGPPVDIWSLGVILYFMLTGKCPFMGNHHKHLLKLIVRGRYQIPHHVPTYAQNLICKLLTVNPKQRPTVQQILQHPWLRQSEYLPYHYHDPLPKHPDPAIIAILFDMGCDPYNTWVSVANRKFDDAMATYLILQHQISQGASYNFQLKAVHVRPRPSPHLLDPSSFPGLPKRSISEPALYNLLLPSENQLPEEAKQLGLRGIRRSSLPAINLCFLPTWTPTPAIASQHDSGSHLPSPLSILSRWTAATDSSSSFQDISTGQPHDNRRGRKTVAGRITTCFQWLCCCMPCVSKNVAPMERGQKSNRCRNRVAPGGWTAETDQTNGQPEDSVLSGS